MALSMSSTAACTLLQSEIENAETSPQSDHKLVALERAEFQRMSRIFHIPDSSTTLAAFCDGPILSSPARSYSVDRSPYLLRGQGSAFQRDALDSNGTFILGAAYCKITRMYLQHPTDVTQAVLRLTVCLVEREVDILRQAGFAG